MKRRSFLAASAAAIAVPQAAPGQQRSAMRRLAVFNPAASAADMSATGSPRFRAFFEELRRLGHAEGRNMVVHRGAAEGRADRLPQVARETVAFRPDVVFAVSNRAVEPLRAVAKSIPIVGLVADPVGFGYASSLARPGGNITGFAIDTGREFVEKHIELLKELVPRASRIAVLIPRDAWEGKVGVFYRAAAAAAGITSVPALLDPPADESEYRRVIFGAARDRVDALYVMAAPENFERRQFVVALAAEVRLPALYTTREHVEAGGLMAYTLDFVDVYRRLANYAGQIFDGANPATMPFQQPEKFHLIVNLKTAKSLDLAIPNTLLARMDEVIE